MSFQPIVPLTGYTGWRFLQRTIETQQTAFDQSRPTQNETDYFRENISKIETADDLINDRRLLSVALGAFGLDEDLNNKYFIKKILEEGTLGGSLASRLSDKRYAALSSSFGFGVGTKPLTNISNLVTDFNTQFESRDFARKAGSSSTDLNFAMNVTSQIEDITAKTTNNNEQWIALLDNASLRNVVEKALDISADVEDLSLYETIETFKQSAKDVFGTDQVSNLADPKYQGKVTRLFLDSLDVTVNGTVAEFNRNITGDKPEQRFALNVSLALEGIVASTSSNNVQWLSVMDNKPLRRVVETMLDLPGQLSQLEQTDQLQALKARAKLVTGSENLEDLINPFFQEQMTAQFLTRSETIVDDIIEKFKDKQFELAVGNANNNLRLALSVSSGLEDILSTASSDNARWFSIMGNKPLREVVQTALGLPSQIATLDLEQQLTAFKERAEQIFGTDEVAGFADPDVQEKMIRLFLVLSDSAASNATSSAQLALQLLQS
jgi:hypothetical protein